MLGLRHTTRGNSQQFAQFRLRKAPLQPGGANEFAQSQHFLPAIGGQPEFLAICLIALRHLPFRAEGAALRFQQLKGMSAF